MEAGMAKQTRLAKKLRERLLEIAAIIEEVDRRCEAADGPVTRTKDEITDLEILRIYKLAVMR